MKIINIVVVENAKRKTFEVSFICDPQSYETKAESALCKSIEESYKIWAQEFEKFIREGKNDTN